MTVGRAASRRAFTLLELLVVMVIILILAGLSFVVIRGAITSARKAQATTEIMGLKGALDSYYNEFSAYPPDTGGWNEAVSDPRSIHRYLGREFVNPATGGTVGPFFAIETVRYVWRDADGVGFLEDPWGSPYHVDALHMETVSGELKKAGQPYLPSVPEEERVRDFKVVSFGPDGESADYPFDQAAPDARSEDDVRSW